MKNFFVNVGKALCYLILFVFVQSAVTYVYMIIEVVKAVIDKGESFMDNFMDNYMEIAQKTIEATDFLYLFMFALTMAALIFFFRMSKKNLRTETWMVPFKFTSAWAIPIAAVCASFLTYLIICYIPWPQSLIDQYTTLSEATVSTGVLSIITTCILAPILEEIIFRGLIFTRLCRGMPAAAAAILASTFFGFVHGTLIWACYAFVCSIIMILIYVKYRSLYASMLFHMVFNLWGGFIQPIIFTGENAVLELYITFAFIAAGIFISYVIYKIPRSKIDISKPAQ